MAAGWIIVAEQIRVLHTFVVDSLLRLFSLDGNLATTTVTTRPLSSECP